MNAEALETLERFGRYLDVDGDNIPWRTLPGTHPDKGAFFTRGTSRDEYAIYTEKGAEYEKNMQRLLAKWQSAPAYLPQPVIDDVGNAMGIIHFGTSACAVREAIEQLAEQGQLCDSLRIRSVPFHSDVAEFIENHEIVYVVEQNRDGQMRSVLINELECAPDQLISIVHYNGDPLSADNVVQGIYAALDQSTSIRSGTSPAAMDTGVSS